MFCSNSKDSSPLAQSGKYEQSQEQNNYTEDFVTLYNRKMNDQQYEHVAQLYSPDALLVWNGQCVSGKNAIHQLLSQLPRSKHVVTSLDMQHLQVDVADQKAFLLQTGGSVWYKDHGTRPFFQTFCTTLIGDKYKITFDNYRSCGDETL